MLLSIHVDCVLSKLCHSVEDQADEDSGDNPTRNDCRDDFDHEEREDQEDEEQNHLFHATFFSIRGFDSIISRTLPSAEMARNFMPFRIGSRASLPGK